MEQQLYITTLYDYYKNLLTEKQQVYFEDYYFNNLTLSEISENYNISRNAVHKQLKEITNKLEEYEKKLNLYNKSQIIKEIIKDIDEKTKSKIEEII